MKNVIYFCLAILAIVNFLTAQTNEQLGDIISSESEKIFISSGTGFFVSEDGYIVTSYHIIEDAKSILVEIAISDTVKEYDAKVIAVDIENDLVVLKVDFDDKNNKSIHYRISYNDIELGSSVFTLGFPMVETMGKSIKLNTGIISSTSGFMGNDHAYQISVPINPGNSGGPLFDENGNLVGVIKSIYSGAENVAYAIKSKHVNNLCRKYLQQKEINMLNKRKDFVDHVRSLKNLVCLIIVTS